MGEINPQGYIEAIAAKTLAHGSKTVTAAATAEALGSDTQCRCVIITAKPGNTGYVYVGGSTVSSSSYGKRLAPEDEITLAVQNLNIVYLDVSVSGEGVDFLRLGD